VGQTLQKAVSLTNSVLFAYEKQESSSVNYYALFPGTTNIWCRKLISPNLKFLSQTPNLSRYRAQS